MASRALAAGLARRMLSMPRLPPGARRLPPVPVPRALREPALWTGAAAAIDRHRLFALRQPMPAAAAALARQVPDGLRRSGDGQARSDGTVTMQDISETVRPRPAGVYAAQLVLTLTPARFGGSLLRADAQVIWFPPRTAAEYIDPARYRVLRISVSSSGSPPHAVSRVVTGRAAITRLAGALNRSPAEPVRTANCAVIFATYRLQFWAGAPSPGSRHPAVSRRGPAAIVVTATRWPCLGARISVHGRPQPALQDAGAVVVIADRLLGADPRP